MVVPRVGLGTTRCPLRGPRDNVVAPRPGDNTGDNTPLHGNPFREPKIRFFLLEIVFACFRACVLLKSWRCKQVVVGCLGEPNT